MLLVVFLALIAASAPYLYGWWITPPDKLFLWLAPYSFEDGNSYLAWVQQAARGRVLMEDLYTTEVGRLGLFLPLYWLMGRLSAGTGLPIMAIYHIARLLLGALVLLAGYRFARAMLPERRSARLALVLMAGSGGMGAFVREFTGQVPVTLDVVAPEAYTLTAIATYPHFLAGMLLLLSLFDLLRRSFANGDFRLAAGAGVLGTLLALVHHFNLVTAWAIPFAYLLCARRTVPPRAWCCYAVMVLLSLPGVAYMAWTGLLDPVWSRLGQWTLRPPGLLWYVGGYGVLLLFAGVGVRSDWRRRDSTRLFPIIWWLCITPILFLPLLPQPGRCVEGMHIPLCVLAAHGLTILDARVRRKHPRLPLAGALAGLTVVGGLSFLALLCTTYQAGSAPWYVPRTLSQAGRWLRAHAPVGTPVMASSVSGNYLPHAAAVRVYIGHFHQTLEYPRKAQTTRAFYADMDDLTRQRLLRAEGIRFVLHGPYERALGPWQPRTADYLTPVSTFGQGRDQVSLYRVR